MTKPLISVITPFLDAEPFIEEAIESVLAQTYENWELLLVDDGSTDGSTAIARAFCQQRPGWIRYFEHAGHANLGQAESRNVALRQAQGEYVALLDADDVWLPDKLKRQVEVLEAHPEAGMLAGASIFWHSWNKRPGSMEEDEIVPVGAPQDTLIHPPRLLKLLYPLGHGAPPCPTSLLIRRRVLDEVGGFEAHFRGMYGIYEDQALLAKIYLHTPVWVTAMCCDRYRQHPGSCVATTMAAGHYEVVREYFLTWFENYLRTQNEVDPEIWRALRNALMPYRHRVRFMALRLRNEPMSTLKDLARTGGRTALPAPVYAWLRTRWRRSQSSIRSIGRRLVSSGDLR